MNRIKNLEFCFFSNFTENETYAVRKIKFCRRYYIGYYIDYFMEKYNKIWNFFLFISKI